MSLEWEQATVDAVDPHALGRWWQEALGWVVVCDDPYEIQPEEGRLPGLLKFSDGFEAEVTDARSAIDSAIAQMLPISVDTMASFGRPSWIARRT